jgi:hypothetical protein
MPRGAPPPPPPPRPPPHEPATQLAVPPVPRQQTSPVSQLAALEHVSVTPARHVPVATHDGGLPNPMQQSCVSGSQTDVPQRIMPGGVTGGPPEELELLPEPPLELLLDTTPPELPLGVPPELPLVVPPELPLGVPPELLDFPTPPLELAPDELPIPVPPEPEPVLKPPSAVTSVVTSSTERAPQPNAHDNAQTANSPLLYFIGTPFRANPHYIRSSRWKGSSTDRAGEMRRASARK